MGAYAFFFFFFFGSVSVTKRFLELVVLFFRFGFRFKKVLLVVVLFFSFSAYLPVLGAGIAEVKQHDLREKVPAEVCLQFWSSGPSIALVCACRNTRIAAAAGTTLLADPTGCLRRSGNRHYPAN